MSEYNTFGTHGSTVTDPDYLVWLDGHDDRKFGMNRADVTPREATEWLYMAVLGVNFGDVKHEVNEDGPTLVFEIVGEKRERYDAITGDKLDSEEL